MGAPHLMETRPVSHLFITARCICFPSWPYTPWCIRTWIPLIKGKLRHRKKLVRAIQGDRHGGVLLHSREWLPVRLIPQVAQAVPFLLSLHLSSKGAILSLWPPRNKRSLLQEGPLSTCDKLLNRRAETPPEGGQNLLLSLVY